MSFNSREPRFTMNSNNLLYGPQNEASDRHELLVLRDDIDDGASDGLSNDHVDKFRTNSDYAEHSRTYRAKRWSRKTGRRIRACIDSPCFARTVSMSVILSAIILLISVIFGIIIIVKYGSILPDAQEILKKIEGVDFDQINKDIDGITKFVDQGRQMANALAQIQNKTVFVEEIVYLVNLMCAKVGCNAGKVADAIKNSA